jgi:dihydrofolate reductase
MAKLVVGTFLTLDGVMQAPGGPGEDPDGGFEHGGWTVPYVNDEAGQLMTGWIEQATALLLGRKTYEIFAAYWPRFPDDQTPFASTLNSIPKYVASRTLDTVQWNNSRLIKGDVAEEIARLKLDTDGEIHVPGSGDLIQTLMKHDLVDEYRLWVFPVLIGKGKRLFAEGTIPGGLRLVDTRTSSTGVASHTYERAGELEYGSFALEEERVR